MVKINANADPESSEHFICARGRFGFDCRKTERRLSVPVKRINGKYEETTWSDVYSAIAEKIKSTDEVGLISTARITTNEDALAIKDFTEKAGIKNIDTTISIYGSEATLMNSQVNIEQADLIILVKIHPSQWERTLPALDAIIRKKTTRKTKLIVISAEDIKNSEGAALTIKADEIATLKGLAKAIIDSGIDVPQGYLEISDAVVTEDIQNAAKMYMEAQKPLIITCPSYFEASQNITLLKGEVLSIPVEANSKGLLMMGLKPKGKSYKEMVNGGVKVLYVIGEVPFDTRPNVDFLIVQNSHMTDLAAHADIVLPSSTYLEKNGTIIDYMGRLKYVRKAVEPVEQAKTHADILFELGKNMGLDVTKPSIDDVKKNIVTNVNPTVKPFEKNTAFEVDPTIMVDRSDISVINFSRTCP